jgi:putative chitinase
MGNTSPEEAAAFIGRGLIQLTGKDNYKAFGEAIGEDLVSTPQLVEQPRYAALSAGWFFNKRNLNALADVMDIETMSKRINGGTIGMADRIAKINKVFDLLTNG